MTTNQQTPARTLTEEQRSEMISQVHSRISSIVEGKNRKTNKQHKDNIRDLMIASTDDGVIAMHEYFTADLTRTLGEERFRFEFIVYLNMSSEEVKSSTVHEFLSFKTWMGTFNQEPRVILSMLRSLHQYHQLPPMEDYSYADASTKYQIAALLTMTTVLYTQHYKRYRENLRQNAGSNGSGLFSPDSTPTEFGLPLKTKPSIMLNDDDLIALVMGQPENVEEISRCIIDEGISDGPLLRDIFTSETPALRGGLI